MGALKVVLIAGAVGGVAYLLLKNANAASASPSPQPLPGNVPSVPPGWTPPTGAIVVQLVPSATPLNVPLALASWPADPGQPAGTYIVIWNTAVPTTFAALFYAMQADGTPAKVPAVMAMGTDDASAKLVSSIAMISAAVQAQNAGTSGLGRLGHYPRAMNGSVLPRYAAISGMGMRGLGRTAMGEYFSAA